MIGGRYRVLSMLGQGGFGRVHEAEDLKLGRLVALELFDLGVPGDFEREARALAKLRHANVVTVFDIVSDGDARGLTMELLRGGSLSALLRRERPPWRTTARLGSEIASGLHHAHERRIVHGDVKPGNVLLDEGVAKVSDFGTARIIEFGTSRTSGFEGTVAHAAPEVVDGKRPSIASDVHPLGCVVLECLMGRPTHRDDLASTERVARALRAVEPRPPEAMRTLVERCLSPRRQDRPDNAGAVALLLAELAGGTAEPPRAGGPAVRPRSVGRERRAPAPHRAVRLAPSSRRSGGGPGRRCSRGRRHSHDAIIVEQARRHIRPRPPPLVNVAGSQVIE